MWPADGERGECGWGAAAGSIAKWRGRAWSWSRYVARHGDDLPLPCRRYDPMVPGDLGPLDQDSILPGAWNRWRHMLPELPPEYSPPPCQVVPGTGGDARGRTSATGSAGAGDVPAASPDPLSLPHGRQASRRHAALSAMRTFFAFLSACRRASGTPPSLPRSGASATSLAAFAKEAVRPTSAFCGRL